MSLTLPDRIYAQYRTKPKAIAWYNITRELAVQLSDAAQAVRIMYNIDTATGEQLNIIGRIVVVDRAFTGQVALSPGLFAELDGSEFGDTEAVFAEPFVDQDNQMSDDLYRLVIKAKILKNNSFSTIEEILHGCNFLIPNAQFLRITDYEDMSFSIEFYGQITDLQRYALLNANLIPKPQGVRFNGFLEGYEYVQFGEDESEFGDTHAEFVGLTDGA